MSGKKKLYSIGQFAAIGNASIRQLYYLEEKGILKPSVRDKDNNYRYYSHDQLDKFVFIKTLRDLGISFEAVVKILESKDQAMLTKTLKHQMEIAQEEIKDSITLYDRLSHYLIQSIQGQCVYSEMRAQNELGSGGAVIGIMDVPKQNMICTRHKSNVSAQELFLDRFFELQKICRSKRIVASGSMMAVFHGGYMKQFQDSAEDLETMFPVDVDLPSQNNARVFGGFRGVCATHLGHYKNMQGLYWEMEVWAKEHDLILSSVSVESYIIGPDMTTNPSQYVTQIIIPLAGVQI